MTHQHFLTLNEFQHKFRQIIVCKNKSYNVKTQVIIAAIGKDLENCKFHVFYDNIVYNFGTVLEAFEAAFQIHHVFNLSYQAQAINFWEFIEYFFYEMQLKIGTTQASITKHADEIKNFEI